MDFNSYNSYDIVFDLKSLSNLKEGFPIIYSKIIKEQFDEIKEERGIVVTAIGNSNKGKTYILSKIFEIKLPFGSTKGISIKYPHNFFTKKNSNQRFVIIDTEGSEKAITISDEDKNEINKLNGFEKIKRIYKIINDRKMTEHFIQNFAIDSASFVIAVVDELIFQEKKFINRLKNECENKTLYIIHNLMYFEKKEEVENYMKKIIEESLFFNIEKREMIILMKEKELNENTVFYAETIKENNNENKYIIHLFMGKEGSEAGNYYNQSTIKFIKENIASSPLMNNFDLIKKFSLFLCQYSNYYFDLTKLDLSEYKQHKFQLIKEENIKTENNCFKVNVPDDLKLKQC